MNNLTEQWKKGELELDKNYYIELEDGTIEIQMYVGGFLCKNDNEVKKVLAPVPSFDELQNINKSVNDLMASNIKLQEENAKLKKLLKRAKVVLEDEGDYMIVQEISQALGEDK